MDLFEEYRHLDKFTLHDAGFLLCDQPPLPPYSDNKPESDRKKSIRSDAYQKTKELIAAARKGHLRLVDKLDEAIIFNREGLTDEEHKIINSGRGFWTNHNSGIWFVTRSDFKEWAIAMELNPTFLFGQETPQLDRPVDEMAFHRLNYEPVVSGIGSENNNRIKLFIDHCKSTKGLKRDDFFKPILMAVEEVNCFDSDDVFSKLMEFSRSEKYQLDSENSNNGYIHITPNGNKRLFLQRKDLRSRLKRLEEKFNQWKASDQIC
ncbi:MAG: hypothetical protein K2Y07_06625 [Nitrosomonas sp.]|nr:hypothetical protein [Nitrosomonas sp.]OQW82703.1 MAG: hypothetical protein BVN30_08175 [Proteobacteria bacterium ST_bin16]